ncbi:MAG: pilus assembly protein PilP [Nitrospirae bacterium]|nr:pilus assembly protein PilP [Nitrospirota bacterium]
MMKKYCCLAAMSIVACYVLIVPGNPATECSAAPPPPPPPPSMDNATATALTPINIERYYYESKDKRDPFLSKIELKKAVTGDKGVQPRQVILSPLQKSELAAIMLKGIVIDKNNKKGNKRYAVVEAGGKAYVITEGTPISEDGKVFRINEDYVVIELTRTNDENEKIKVYVEMRLRNEGQE